jgi:hypothetical protein
VGVFTNDLGESDNKVVSLAKVLLQKFVLNMHPGVVGLKNRYLNCCVSAFLQKSEPTLVFVPTDQYEQ